MEEEVIENFYGVYLLYCENPKHKGRTYVGYTVNPNRRLMQHNKGVQYQGARRTNNRGPWTMALIVHGFPNDIAALRFEWAWQHPLISKRLRHIHKKKPSEKLYDFHLRVLSEMLQVIPWSRLPLTVRWLNENLIREFPPDKRPPLHMPICFGAVVSKKVDKSSKETEEVPYVSYDICDICYKAIDDDKLTCLNSSCKLSSHIICLSELFLQPGEYIPVEGKCPKCEQNFLWGDFIRKLKGCYNTDTIINTESTEDYDI